MENECKNPMGVLHSFSIKSILYDKMDFKLFYFLVTRFTQKCTLPPGLMLIMTSQFWKLNISGTNHEFFLK